MHSAFLLLVEILAFCACLFYAGLGFLGLHYLEIGRFDVNQALVSSVFCVMGVSLLGIASMRLEKCRRDERNQNNQ
ncbi:hypothetical protein [Pseudodesulfovibrio pelocollis]|uniref:hypothetical protein n=1 Tax=Pseudodesulfovibrio pelocollis TaxID=3051432 RepID=UPI00255AABE8|nr:hypothetical protein [Pseudodesulfovibrio sp. SB368]